MIVFSSAQIDASSRLSRYELDVPYGKFYLLTTDPQHYLGEEGEIVVYSSHSTVNSPNNKCKMIIVSLD